MIHIQGITKNFGSLQVLKGINLDIAKGEFVSIIGASGAGKTTLLQIIGSLEKADSGILTVDGISLHQLSDKELAAFRGKHIGFVFQFHHLLPEFTALENVMIPALIAKDSPSDAKKRAVEILKSVGLGSRLEHKPSELSGGEQQRVAIARAIINNPSVIFADEPSGNLDSQTKGEIHRLFFDLRDLYGQTIIIVTHDNELAQMSDRILKMKDGLFI
jgi:lipoprotein-releasing system ATP-binding protein